MVADNSGHGEHGGSFGCTKKLVLGHAPVPDLYEAAALLTFRNLVGPLSHHSDAQPLQAEIPSTHFTSSLFAPKFRVRSFFFPHSPLRTMKRKWTTVTGVDGGGPPLKKSNAALPLNNKFLPFRGVVNDTKTYLPLDSAMGQIRYVAVDPGASDAPVSCFLGYTSLQKDSELRRLSYEAVSYCWGDVSDTVEISLRCAKSKRATASSGCRAWALQQYRVTRNLDTLLRAFRLPDKHRILWVDAICINQGAPSEKTLQVGFMGSIYSSASRVLVWLGEADLFSSIMVESYRIFASKLAGGPLASWYQSRTRNRRDMWPGGDGGSLWYTSILRDKVLGDLIEKGYIPSLDAYHTHVRLPKDKRYLQPFEVLNVISWSAERLFSRPWFRRIWVLQEIVLAPTTTTGLRLVTVFMGQSNIEWNELVAFARILHNIPGFTFENHTFFDQNWSQLTIPPIGSTRTTHTVEDYIHKTMSFISSDPRDKFFAILQLSEDTRDVFKSTELLLPDYTKSLRAVLRDYRRWRLEQSCQVIDRMHSHHTDYNQSYHENKYVMPHETDAPKDIALLQNCHYERDGSEDISYSRGAFEDNSSQEPTDAEPEVSENDDSEFEDSEVEDGDGHNGDTHDSDSDDSESSDNDSRTSDRIKGTDSDTNPVSTQFSPEDSARFEIEQPLDYIIHPDFTRDRTSSRVIPSWATDTWTTTEDHRDAWDMFQAEYGTYNASQSKSAVLLTGSSQLAIDLKGLRLAQIQQCITLPHGWKDTSRKQVRYRAVDIVDLWQRLKQEILSPPKKITRRERLREAIAHKKANTKRLPARMLPPRPQPTIWKPTPRLILQNQTHLTANVIPQGPFTTGNPPVDDKHIYTTTDGDFVLAQAHARPTDIIVILYGSRVPLVLRCIEVADTNITPIFRLIGPCFFHQDKWMKGKELASGALDHVPEEFYTIV
jgi:hypothetical protein